MKATLIGHACWLVETDAGAILTDPVFFDPFEEGAVVSCPKRVVRPEQLPKLSAIYLSHRHADHFDCRTLALLDKALPVFCPDDELVLASLSELGFRDFRRLTAFRPMALGPVTLFPVPSYAEDLLEFGTVFRDGTATLFNQVDCPLDENSVAYVKEHVGQLDVHFAMYASQSFGFFESRADSTEETYAYNVFTALDLGARTIVPASAGFRFADHVGWWNRHLFPISCDRFVGDLRRLAPERRVETLNPGDALQIAHGDVRILRQQAPFCATVEDDTHLLAWDGSAPVPALVDPNLNGYPVDFLRQFGRGIIENGLRTYLDQVMPASDPLVASYLANDVVYQVEVVYPDATSDTFTLTFDRKASSVQIEAGDRRAPTVLRRITASALADLTAGRRGVFAVRTEARRSSMVVGLSRAERGLEFEDVRLPDLLFHFVLQAKVNKVGLQRAQREYYGLVPHEA